MAKNDWKKIEGEIPSFDTPFADYGRKEGFGGDAVERAFKREINLKGGWQTLEQGVNPDNEKPCNIRRIYRSYAAFFKGEAPLQVLYEGFDNRIGELEARIAELERRLESEPPSGGEETPEPEPEYGQYAIPGLSDIVVVSATDTATAEAIAVNNDNGTRRFRAIAGHEVLIEMSGEGYVSESYTFLAKAAGGTLNFSLTALCVTISYAISPSMAEISFYNNTKDMAIVPVNKQFTVDYWDEIAVTAHCGDDYNDLEEVFVAKSTETEKLFEMQEKTFRVTVNCVNVPDALVTINGIVGNVLDVKKGNSVVYLVQADGYMDAIESFTDLQEDKTVSVTLDEGDMIPQALADDAQRVYEAIQSIDSDELVVWGVMSDLHANLVGDNQSGTDSVKTALMLQAQMMAQLGQMDGIDVEACFITGDIVGRCSPDNETYEDLVENMDYIQTVNSAYSAKYGNSIPYVLISGNHDARAFAASGYTVDDTRSFFNRYNGRGNYAPKYAKSGCSYHVNEERRIVFAIIDPYDYRAKEGAASERFYDSMSEEINRLYNGYKVVVMAHQPFTASHRTTPNSDFWTENCGVTPSLSQFISSSDNVYGNLLANGGKIICSIHGHQHADVVGIDNGFPIIQHQVVGKLVVNDGGTYRRNWYNAVEAGGYTAEGVEIENDTLAKASFNVYVWDNEHSDLYMFRVGVGPDMVFHRDFENNSTTLSNFGVLSVNHTPSVSNNGYQYRVAAAPDWNVDTVASVLRVGSETYHPSAYHYDAQLIDVGDGVWQNPFVPVGWWYFLIEGYKGNNGKWTTVNVSDIHPPLTEATVYETLGNGGTSGGADEFDNPAGSFVVNGVTVNYIFANEYPTTTSSEYSLTLTADKTPRYLFMWINNLDTHGISSVELQSGIINYSNRGTTPYGIVTYSSNINPNTCLGLGRGSSGSYNASFSQEVTAGVKAVSWSYGNVKTAYCDTLFANVREKLILSTE